MKKWKTLSSELVYQSNFLRFRSDVCELEDGRIKPHYFILEMKNWVNVIAVTKDQRLLLVRQYRHAAKNISLEIPGGAIDDADKSPEMAGRRELLEETGYQAGDVIFSARHFPNPALQCNEMFTYVFVECEKISEPHWDEFEEMEIDAVTIEELNAKIRSGEINHSLILASLFLAWPTIEERLKNKIKI